MFSARRHGGFPLAVYVTALLGLPLVAVAVLSTREVQRNNEKADGADGVAAAIDLQAAIVNVVAPLQVERTAQLGLARMDDLDVDRELAITFTGVDFDGIRAANAVSLDAALDDLATVVDDQTDSLGIGEPRRLVALRESLEAVRSATDARTADIDELAATFAGVTAYLAELTHESNDALDDNSVVTAEAADLLGESALLSAVVQTASVESQMLTDALVLGTDIGDVEMMANSVRHADALALAAEEIDRLRPLQDSYAALRPVPAELREVAARDVSQLAPFIGTITDLQLERIDYLEQVETATARHGADMSTRAQALAESADLQNRLTLIGLAIVGVGSLLFGAAVIRSFVGPLNRLRNEAEEIGKGSLSVHELPLRGPSDIRKVTAAVNEMTGTLSLMDEHMKLLGAGAPRDARVLAELPGEIGASMRHSVQRVTELTNRLQQSEVRLELQARHDNLTGLPNRFAVLERLDHLLESVSAPHEIGIMFVDIDGFKTVNDTHGHAIGDTVLAEIAARLASSVRDGDYVARLGGDEFLVIVDECDERMCLTSFGERIIREIEQPYVVGDQLFTLSASVGATTIDHDDDALTAIKRADAAVYQAKQRGRRRVEMFDAELQDSIEQQAALELALRQAITGDELRLYLQPLGDLRSGLASGAEALVRWDRPGVGLVPPGDFIPIAERSGLIFELERWVLREACSRLVVWEQIDPTSTRRLAVNISGRHLIEGELLADLDDVLTTTGANPALLEIELTESHLLDDVGRASAVLGELRRRGISVAIDDFGTGYSSMTYLQKLPVDVVKIDQSFISRATENDFDSTIVEAVVTIGRTLALEVVAEGVETQAQLAYVMRKGVTRAQGYLLARPMPAAEADRIVFNGPIIDVRTATPIADYTTAR